MQTRAAQRATLAAADPAPGRRTRSNKPTFPDPPTTSKPKPKSKKQKSKKREESQIEEIPAEQELPQDHNEELPQDHKVEAPAAQDSHLPQQDENGPPVDEAVDANVLDKKIEMQGEMHGDEDAQMEDDAINGNDLDKDFEIVGDEDAQMEAEVINWNDLEIPGEEDARMEDAGSQDVLPQDEARSETLPDTHPTDLPYFNLADPSLHCRKGYSGAFFPPFPPTRRRPPMCPPPPPMVPAPFTHANDDTAAKEQKEVARLNGIAKGLKSNMMPLIMSQEEQDEEDYDEFMNNTGSGEGKGKAKAQQTKDGAAEDSEEEEDRGAEGDDEDSAGEDDEDDAGAWQPPWDIMRGVLSDADLKAAQAARQNYHDNLEVIARRAGKKMSAIFKAVGDHGSNRRQINPWNAHGMKYRKDHPKPTGMSKKEYAAELKAAYHDLFSSLTEDEVNDPDARRACVEPVMEWYNNQMAAVVDSRKADGCGKALLKKAVLPFIHQSTITSNSLDIEVFGFAIDPYGNSAVIWGGTSAFAAVHETYDQAIKAKLVDMKAMFQMVNIAKRQAEANALVQPIAIDFRRKESEKNERDARRRIIGQLFLNDIHLILGGRNDDASALKKMSWKWADMAIQHHLRIKNWPVELVCLRK
ncbi:hypothetical protein C8R44DRAFT_885381 [Mycena epipterygia]|nr:hypothetical protein C8R44DRAFT_885381 [Mycena epipterygia]